MALLRSPKFQVPVEFDINSLKNALQQEFGSRYPIKNSKAGFTPSGLLICYSPSKAVWVTVTYQEKKSRLVCMVGPSTSYMIFGLAGVLLWNARYKSGIDSATQAATSFLGRYLPNASK